MFVGESKFETCPDTLYAIPSYIDDNTPTIKRNAINLLEGPNSKNEEAGTTNSKRSTSNKRNYIIFGHYDKPSTETIFDTIGSKVSDQQLTVQTGKSLWYQSPGGGDEKIIIPDDSPKKINESTTASKEGIVKSKKKYGLLKTVTIKFKTWFDNEENKILKLMMVILIGTVITMFWYFHTTVRELRQQSQNGSNTKIPRSTDSNGSYGVESLNGGEFIFFLTSIVIVDVGVVVNFIHGMINDLRLVDNFQMFLKSANNHHKVHFQACKNRFCKLTQINDDRVFTQNNCVQYYKDE